MLCLVNTILSELPAYLEWAWVPFDHSLLDNPAAWAVLMAACHAENTVVCLNNTEPKRTGLEMTLLSTVSAKSKLYKFAILKRKNKIEIIWACSILLNLQIGWELLNSGLSCICILHKNQLNSNL